MEILRCKKIEGLYLSLSLSIDFEQKNFRESVKNSELQFNFVKKGNCKVKDKKTKTNYTILQQKTKTNYF